MDRMKTCDCGNVMQQILGCATWLQVAAGAARGRFAQLCLHHNQAATDAMRRPLTTGRR